MDIKSICTELRKGAEILALHNEAKKNHALRCVSESIKQHKKEILEAMTRKLQSEYPEMSSEEALAKAKSYIYPMP